MPATLEFVTSLQTNQDLNGFNAKTACSIIVKIESVYVLPPLLGYAVGVFLRLCSNRFIIMFAKTIYYECVSCK